MAAGISSDNPMYGTLRVTLGFWVASIIILVIGIVAAVHWGGNGAGGLIGILACTWGGLGTLLCPIFLIPFRNAAKEAQDVLNGPGRIARWSCSAEEWNRFVAAEAKPKNKSATLIFVVVIVSVLIVIFAIAAGTSGGPPLSAGEWALIISVMAGTLVFIFGIVWLAKKIKIRRLRNARNHDIAVGTCGVVLAGRFTSWDSIGAHLEHVKYEPGDPGNLHFRWMQPGAGMYALPSPMEINVPVPKGSEGEAQRVVVAFRNMFKGPQTPVL